MNQRTDVVYVQPYENEWHSWRYEEHQEGEFTWKSGLCYKTRQEALVGAHDWARSLGSRYVTELPRRDGGECPEVQPLGYKPSRWEYQQYSVQCEADIRNHLAISGNEGWELVTYQRRQWPREARGYIELVFKRPRA